MMTMIMVLMKTIMRMIVMTKAVVMMAMMIF